MWKAAYLESTVLSAQPVELVCLVYGHAIESVRDARGFLAKGDIASRARAIGRAMDAVSELEGSLNHCAGGAVSGNLADLYRYVRQRLTEGNIRQLDAPLAEAETLLSTLAEAWQGVRQQGRAVATAQESAPPEALSWMDQGVDCAHAWSA
jgi:flagellar secretion chaperone FliS